MNIVGNRQAKQSLEMKEFGVNEGHQVHPHHAPFSYRLTYQVYALSVKDFVNS